MTGSREFASEDLRQAVKELRHKLQEANFDTEQFDVQDVVVVDELLGACARLFDDVNAATRDIERVVKRLEAEDAAEAAA